MVEITLDERGRPYVETKEEEETLLKAALKNLSGKMIELGLSAETIAKEKEERFFKIRETVKHAGAYVKPALCIDRHNKSIRLYILENSNELIVYPVDVDGFPTLSIDEAAQHLCNLDADWGYPTFNKAEVGTKAWFSKVYLGRTYRNLTDSNGVRIYWDSYKSEDEGRENKKLGENFYGWFLSESKKFGSVDFETEEFMPSVSKMNKELEGYCIDEEYMDKGILMSSNYVSFRLVDRSGYEKYLHIFSVVEDYAENIKPTLIKRSGERLEIRLT